MHKVRCRLRRLNIVFHTNRWYSILFIIHLLEFNRFLWPSRAGFVLSKREWQIELFSSIRLFRLCSFHKNLYLFSSVPTCGVKFCHVIPYVRPSFPSARSQNLKILSPWWQQFLPYVLPLCSLLGTLDQQGFTWHPIQSTLSIINIVLTF